MCIESCEPLLIASGSDCGQITDHERSLRRLLIGAKREGALYQSAGGDRFTDGDLATVLDVFAGLFGAAR